MKTGRRALAALAGGAAITFLPTPPAHAMSLPTAAGQTATTLPTQTPINLPPLLKHYGAIAYSHNGASGIARRQLSKLAAQQLAMQRCGTPTCTVVTTFTQCGAVAHDGARYHGGLGLSRTAAETHAISRLGSGWIVDWACN
jgi:hypothetical protein